MMSQCTVHVIQLVYSEGKQWKEARSKWNPVFVPRKLGRHVHKLNAVNDTFIRVAQEGAEADGYSKDLMELLPYWSMEGTAWQCIRLLQGSVSDAIFYTREVVGFDKLKAQTRYQCTHMCKNDNVVCNTL